MYLIFDVHNKFIQFGAGKLQSLEDFLWNQIHPSYLIESFEKYRRSVSCMSFTMFSQKEWDGMGLRISWRGRPIFSILHPSRFHKRGNQSYIITCIETFDHTESLPTVVNKRYFIEAQDGCVRVDSAVEKQLFSVHQVFSIDHRRYVVSEQLPKITSTKKSPRQRRKKIAFSLLSILSFGFGVCFFVKINFKNSDLIFQKNYPREIPQETFYSAFSAKLEDLMLENHFHHKEKPVIHERPVSDDKKKSKSPAKSPTKGNIDPVRCTKISAHETSRQTPSSEGSTRNRERWYVCR